jgi:hypothetical protein
MSWLAGYHNSSGAHHDNIRATWAKARAIIVDELDQRLIGYLLDPEGHETQIEELTAALRDFGELVEGDQGAADADGLTFVLVPACTAALRKVIEDQADELTAALQEEVSR